jgi:predicted Zn-dependent protease
MKPLEPPDSIHLLAAQGWLELGSHIEANDELENISASLRAHPAVLAVRWEIYAAAKKWEAAVDIAAALIQLDPEDPVGWVHRSYALHELKRTTEARDNLLRVVDKFPSSATMRYNLDCYECQLGRLEKAKEWLKKAFALSGKLSPCLRLVPQNRIPRPMAFGGGAFCAENRRQSVARHLS